MIDDESGESMKRMEEVLSDSPLCECVCLCPNKKRCYLIIITTGKLSFNVVPTVLLYTEIGLVSSSGLLFIRCLSVKNKPNK